MGVSFKISKIGSRFKPKPLVSEAAAINDVEDISGGKIHSKNESNNSATTASVPKHNGRDEDAVGLSGSSLSSRRHISLSEDEVSFVLNLYLDGYSIGKPPEVQSNGHFASLQDTSKSLLPYDRISETLFSAIEAGTLPGDVLDDIPCKFINGTVICEVRDFRKCATDAGSNVASADIAPIITRLRLRMSLENVVKDIPLMADDSWSYGDLMEVESRILKALQPKLCLDPNPRLDRLCEDPHSPKINFGLSGLRKRRRIQIPEITVTTSNRLHGKKISMGQPQEGQSYRLGGSGPGDLSSQYAHESLTGQNIGPTEMLPSRVRNFAQDNSMSGMNVIPHPSKFPHGPGSQRITNDSVLNASSVPSASGQDMSISYNDSANSNTLLHGKMDAQEALMSQYSNKRTKIAGSLGSDSIPQQPVGSYMDSLQASDVQWRNQGLSQQMNLRGIQYGNNSLQKYPSLARDGSMNQDIASSASIAHQGLRYGVNGEPIVPEKLDKAEMVRVKNDPQTVEGEHNPMDPRFQHRSSSQAFMRPGFHQGGWNIHNQQVDKDPRKEDPIQRRKSAHNPRVSAGITSQSALSAKSADMASGSQGNQYAAVPSPAQHGYSQKSGNMMPHLAHRSQSVTSSGNNDSMQHQHQTQVAAKWRSNSLPKTPGLSGVGSPASVSNMSVPMNAASPSVGTPPMADHTMLERFAKIEMVTTSHKLHRKRAKADEVSRKLPAFSAREVTIGLTNAANMENIRDENCTMPLSRSIVGGSMNISKIRVLTFMPSDRTMPVSPFVGASPRIRTRLIMSEKPPEGSVAMHFGEIEDKDYLSIEDCLPYLSNTHYADLLASQLSTLMSREGYQVEDHIQPRPPTRPNNPLHNLHNVAGSSSEMQQGGETAPMSGQPSGESRPNSTAPISSPPNSLASAGGMLSSGNPRGLQSSQGHIPGGSSPVRPQQMGDPHQPSSQQAMQLQNQQQMIQHNPQLQRSLLMPPNSLPQMNAMGQNSSLPMSNPMVNNKSSHLQMLQNQPPTQPQMQQSQMPRKMMMGLGPAAMGMGNLANNMVGLGGLGNMMGIGGVGPRGMPVAGMSSAMGPVPGLGNMAQNPVGLSASSNLSPANLSAISHHLRSGALTPAQQQLLLTSRIRMSQSRGMLGGPHQQGVAGLSGARNMQPGPQGLSMLGQTLNRGSAVNPMQRSALGMAAPRLMTGMNVHMSPQQQFQLQQQQQMQQPQQMQQQQLPQPQQQPPQQQQPQPQQLQQQEASSLQAVLSPQQVSSPSGVGVPQPSVNQMIAQSPQLSSGAVQNPPSNSNVEPVGPGSPQLSSQTLGSVGSITNSHGLARGEQE